MLNILIEFVRMNYLVASWEQIGILTQSELNQNCADSAQLVTVGSSLEPCLAS